MRELLKISIYKITEDIEDFESGDFEGEFIYDGKVLTHIDDYEDSVIGKYNVDFSPMTDGIKNEIDNIDIKDFLNIYKPTTNWNKLLDYMIKELDDDFYYSLILIWDIVYSRDYWGECDVDYNYLGVLNLETLTIKTNDELIYKKKFSFN